MSRGLVWFAPLLLLVAAACGSGGAAPSVFWDTDKNVAGKEFFGYVNPLSLSEMVGYADAIVTVRVTDAASVEFPQVDRSNAFYRSDSERAQAEHSNEILDSIPLSTTYEADVDSWIKGAGDSQLQIRSAGGISAYDGSPQFFDGFFLLEPGRSYLLILNWDEAQRSWQLGPAREGFDITHGVKVMNHSTTADLEYLEKMSVDELVAEIASLAKS
jgi:hypothetical protein